MKVTGCGAQMQRLMDVSVDDVVAIENSLGRRVEMGEPKKDAQANAVGDVILELELKKREIAKAVEPKLSGRFIDSPDDIDGLGNFNLDAYDDLSWDELAGSYNPEVDDIDISPNLDTVDFTTTKSKIKAAVDAYGFMVEDGFKKPSFSENEYGDLVSRVKAGGKEHDFIVQPDGDGWRVLTRNIDFGGRGHPISFGSMSGDEVADFIRRNAAAIELNKQKFDLLSTLDKDAIDRVADYWMAVGQNPKALELTQDTEPGFNEKPIQALNRIARERAGALGMTASVGQYGGGLQLMLTDKSGDEHEVGIELIKGLKTPAVTIHAAGLSKGSGAGKVIYSIVNSWAAERDLMIVADVDGLTAVNAVRRTENGLSAAARGNGNMVSGVAQRVYGYNDKPKTEEDARKNLVRLAVAQLRNVLELAPEAENLTYIPETGKFDDEALVAKLLQRPEVRKNSLGRTSFARAVLTGQILIGAELEPSDFAKPVLYSERVQEGEFSAVLEDRINKDGWLKAPNGKDTNLGPEQWVMARTPSFVQWFGNWELAAKTQDPTIRLAGGLDGNGEPLGVYFADVDDIKPIYPSVMKGDKKLRTPAARRSDMRPATDEDMARLKIPRAFEYAMVAMDEANADLLWTAMDAAGRKRYGYKAEYQQDAMQVKFQRMQRFYAAFPEMIDQIKRDSVRGNEQALVMRLIALTGFRVGGESSGRIQSYGASSLEPRHVEVRGDTLVFNFTGKSGVKQSHAVRDDVLAQVIQTRYNQPKIFDTSDDRVRVYLRSVNEEFKVHDFRMHAATRAALAAAKSVPVPVTPDEFWAAYDAAIEAGAKRIGDTRDVAESTYIDPSIFAGWRKSAGVPAGSKKPRNTRRIRGAGAAKPADAGLNGGNDVGVLRQSKRVADAVDEFLSVKKAYDDLLTGDVKDVTLEQFSVLTDRSIAAKSGLVDALASEEDLGLMATAPDGRMLTLTPSAQKPGQWQLTRFALDNTPWGDTNYTTREQALGDFVEEADVTTVINSVGVPVVRYSDRQIDTPEFKRWYGDWEAGAKNARGLYDGGGDQDVNAVQRRGVLEEDSDLPTGVRRYSFSGASGPVGADGKPVVFFHGTRETFSVFQLDHPGRKDFGWLGRGVYVTSDPDIAHQYAQMRRGSVPPTIMPLYAAVKNPYFATAELKQKLRKATQESIDRFTQSLKDQGHDGVAMTFEDGHIELVAFNPSDVKSAIGNNGNFDPTNPDIRHSKREQALIDRISADGITSPDDLRDLLRVPGFGQRKKSTVMQDPARAQTLRADLSAAFPGTDWRRPILNDQGIVSVFDSWNGLSQESLERLAAIADENDAPVVVRGYGTGSIDLASLGFTPYWGVQQMDGRMSTVKIAHIRPGGGITNTTPLYSERDSLGYYSELEDKVAESTMKQAPAAAWKTYIKALTQKGVKPDEIEWSGVMDWLDAQEGKVKKEDLVAYLEQGGVKVQETVLGGESMDRDDAAQRMYGVYFDELTPKEKSDVLSEIGSSNPTKYGNYTLPGGENYREVLLTLPATREDTSNWSAHLLLPKSPVTGKPEFQILDGNGEVRLVVRTADTEDQALETARKSVERGQTLAKGDYRSSHWDQPNVLAHIRVNDRTDADGAKALFIEEVQSDFQQDYRKSKDAIRRSVESDFDGIVERMKKAGVLEVVCD